MNAHGPATDRSAALVALHVLGLPLFASVTYTAALPVLAAIVVAFLGADVWEELEHLALSICVVEQPREALAAMAEMIATDMGPSTPGVAAPLQELARLLRLPLPTSRPMLDATEPPGCLAGGVTTRGDVAPIDMRAWLAAHAAAHPGYVACSAVVGVHAPCCRPVGHAGPHDSPPETTEALRARVERLRRTAMVPRVRVELTDAVAELARREAPTGEAMTVAGGES